MNVTLADVLSVLPETLIVVVGLGLVFLDLLFPRGGIRPLAGFSLAGFSLAGYAAWLQLKHPTSGFGGSIVVDGFSIIFELIFLLVGVFTVLLSVRNLENQQLRFGEYYALVMFSISGMMLMVSANDLLLVFIGLEILSICSYILCGLDATHPHSNESAMKYFLLGAFASAIWLYGAVMLYGASGSLQLDTIASEASDPENPLLLLGAALLLTGFGFKIALVPFHMWTPDVYEGAPTSITAFLSAGPKAAGFAALARLLLEALPHLQATWSLALWTMAILTMTTGNLMALKQNNLKRMLAYSSIAHAGYIAVALTVSSTEALSGIVFYSLVYTLMNTGVFAIIILASSPKKECLTFDDYAGFGYRKPFLALALFIMMLSLAGIPLTAGFVGKFQIFKSAIEQGWLWLTIIGVLNSVISVYYYLRLVVVMYMQPAEQKTPTPSFHLPLYFTVFVCFGGVLYLGLFPSTLLDFVNQHVQTFP